MPVLLIYFPIQSNGLSIEFFERKQFTWYMNFLRWAKWKTPYCGIRVIYLLCAEVMLCRLELYFWHSTAYLVWDCVLFSWSGELDWAGDWATARIVVKKILRWLWKACACAARLLPRPPWIINIARIKMSASKRPRKQCNLQDFFRKKVTKLTKQFIWSCYIGVNANLRCIRVAIPWRRILHSLLCEEKNVKWSPKKSLFWRRNYMEIYASKCTKSHLRASRESKISKGEGDTPPPGRRSLIKRFSPPPPHSKIASYAYAPPV